MDQFVTTYRKDFLWPYIRAFGRKPTISSYETGQGDSHCPCKCIERTNEEYKLLAPNVFDRDTYTKLGPATPLMDPKLYPARVAPPPESENQRFNQPNIFLEKLRLKYPFLYEVIKSAPPEDMISRISKDRLRTTYEVDYCHLQEYPNAPYDELLRAAGVSGMPPCPEPEKLPGDPCRPNQRSLAFRAPAQNTVADYNAGFAEKCSGGSLYPPSGPNIPSKTAIVGMGTTEYQDAISKLGELIIRDKIHMRKPKTIFN